VREGLDGLGGSIFGGGEVREDLAGLAEGDAGAVLKRFGDGAVGWGEGGDVVVEDLAVGVCVEVGGYGEELWRGC
jgi:hypothetical protein